MTLKPGKKTPFDSKGNDNSIPVGPGGKWAGHSKNKDVQTAFNQGYNSNGKTNA